MFTLKVKYTVDWGFIPYRAKAALNVTVCTFTVTPKPLTYLTIRRFVYD